MTVFMPTIKGSAWYAQYWSQIFWLAQAMQGNLKQLKQLNSCIVFEYPCMRYLVQIVCVC